MKSRYTDIDDHGRRAQSRVPTAQLLIFAMICAVLSAVGPFQSNTASASSPGLTFQSVAAGDRFTLALGFDGNIYSWGDNAVGQLGDGTLTSRTSPGPVSTLNFENQTFSAIAAGTDFALALRNDGTVFGWGENSNGQSGDGTTVDRNLPVQISSAQTFSQIVAGGGFGLALTDAGVAYSWGSNVDGQLGDNSNTTRTSPVAVQTALTFRTLSAGSSHVVAIASDGKLYSWGQGTYGQLGFSTGWVADKKTPSAVDTSLVGSRTFSAVAAGSIFSLALDAEGNAFSWGQNQFGQLGIGVFGDGTSATNKTVPVTVNSSTTFSAVTAVRWHVVAIASSGNLFSWGINANSQIGDGTSTNRHSPTAASTQSSGLLGFTDVSAGPGIQANHTIALASDGALFSWGWNDYGQLGSGSTNSISRPTGLAPYSPGPVAAIGGTSSSVTSVAFDLTCAGTCGPGNAFDYTSVLLRAGLTVAAESGVASATSVVVEYTNLEANVVYTVETSVTFNGQRSATVSSVITTPKPVATISALSVADTSATLAVGCTNCGTVPDSFTVFATPVAGGPAITSNTNQISGLSSETTYSCSVVAAFAGTTSDVVLWQSNPVMTLPFVPIISAVSPPAVPLTGGSITVAGSNFTTSTELTLDGVTLSFTVVSGTQITFTAPSDTAGSYDLAITNPVGTYTLSNAITYVSGPTLVTNSPVLGTTNGGTIVTLTGTNLITTTQVNVGSTTVSFSVISNSAVRFVTAATSAGVVDIGVVTIGGAATLSSALEFTSSPLIPVVSSITPTSGPNSGGTLITVTGQYFSGSYSDSVLAAINGVSGSSVILIDDSTLTFVSPAGTAGAGLDVSVATGGGLGTLAGAFTYTAPTAPVSAGSAPAVVVSTPTITEFSTRKISAAGAQVSATGLRLENISVLTLGGITVTIVSNTATSITFNTGEMPVGVWDLRLVASNGTVVFQQAIEVLGIQEITPQSSGELIGFAVTLRFTGNSRALNVQQEGHLQRRLKSEADTIICWGYTTAQDPNSWALAHANARAQAACNLALESMPGVSSIVRLRYGMPKDLAMRASVQFWKK